MNSINIISDISMLTIRLADLYNLFPAEYNSEWELKKEIEKEIEVKQNNLIQETKHKINLSNKESYLIGI